MEVENSSAAATGAKFADLIQTPSSFTIDGKTVTSSPLLVSLSSAAGIIDDVDDNQVNLEPRPTFYPQADGNLIIVGKEGDKPFIAIISPSDSKNNRFFCSANWRDVTYVNKDKIVVVNNIPSQSEVWSYQSGNVAHPFKAEKRSIVDQAYYYHSQVMQKNRHARILKPFSTALIEKEKPLKQGEEAGEQKISYVVNSADEKPLYKFPIKWKILGDETPDGYGANHAGLLTIAASKTGGGGDQKYLAWYSNSERKLIKRKVDTTNGVRIDKMDTVRVHGATFSFQSERDYQVAGAAKKGLCFLSANTITGLVKRDGSKEVILPGLENIPSQTYYPAPDGLVIYNNNHEYRFHYATLGKDNVFKSFEYSKKFYYSFEPLNKRFVWTLYKDDNKVSVVNVQTGDIIHTEFRAPSVTDHITQGWAHRFTFTNNSFGFVTSYDSSIHKRYNLLHVFKLVEEGGKAEIKRAHLLEFPRTSVFAANRGHLFNINVEKCGTIKAKRIQITGGEQFKTDNFVLSQDGVHRTVTHVYVVSRDALLLHMKNKTNNTYEWKVFRLTKEKIEGEVVAHYKDYEILGSSNGFLCATRVGESHVLNVWPLEDPKNPINIDYGAKSEILSVTFVEGHDNVGAVSVKTGNNQDIILEDFKNKKRLGTISTGAVSFKAIKAIPENNQLLCSGFEYFTVLNLDGHLH